MKKLILVLFLLSVSVVVFAEQEITVTISDEGVSALEINNVTLQAIVNREIFKQINMAKEDMQLEFSQDKTLAEMEADIETLRK